ncbi:MAG: Na+/H+ antiporter NhaC [Lautropia sp.]|nr:Na+/H+ antiporter NhaC [Lautropia sp.]
MNNQDDAMDEPRTIPFRFAIIPMLVMITVMAIAVIKLEASPHVPLLIGTITASFIATVFGFKWRFIEESAYQGIKMALPAIVIIIMIGLTIGAWIGGGIVATMVYYGLKLLSPSMFLFTICLICALVTLAIGSSWATMGTIGVAAMGIGLSIDIPAPMVAGAIISGAYFGDKMSPLSDTTNLAAGITGTDLFEHIKHMFYTTIPGLMVALVVFYFMGSQFHASTLNADKIDEVLRVLETSFNVSPWLLLVPLLVIVMIGFKTPALPALTGGILMGWLCHVFVQGGEIGTAVQTLQAGYKLESGNAMVDELFNRGGIDAMMDTVSLTIVAMTFGGVMEKTGMLRALVEKILRMARSTAGLISATITSAFLTNLTTSEQYISILLPGRMYVEAFRRKRLLSKNLSRALEDGGTITSVLVPWNTCGVFAASMLGVTAFEYAPYAVLNYSIPVIAIVMAFLGIGVTRMTPAQEARAEAEEKAATQVKTGRDRPVPVTGQNAN